MSLGVLGGQSRRRRRPQVQALGATIPSTCWDKPGFKDCHARMWEVARDACEGGLAKKEYGGNVGTCIDTEANDGSYYGCALRICPPPVQPSPISYGGWTWLSSTPNASIKTFQTHLNTALSREGYKPINADGKLGPATCGAFKTVGGAHPGLFTSDPIANLRICQAWTNPTKVGQTKPVSDPVSPIAAELDQKYGQLPWGQPDDRVASLQQQLNVQLVGHGLKPIGVTGMLDSATCGAMRFLDRETGSRWMATWGAACKGFAEPAATLPPETPKPATVPTTTVPVVVDAGPSSTSGSSAGLIAAGLAVVAVAGGLWAKSKGFF